MMYQMVVILSRYVCAVDGLIIKQSPHMKLMLQCMGDQQIAICKSKIKNLKGE